MKLIIGLGNPGKQYENTRHNIGFIFLDHYCNNKGIIIDKKKFNGLYAKEKIFGEDVVFLKPQSFMNLSGEVVQQFVNYFKIKPQDILVINDDLDLFFGNYRLKQKGSSGGHNGLKDIERHLGTNAYKRLKIGISNNKNIDTKDYVLGKFSKEEEKTIANLKEIVNNILDDFLQEDFNVLMSKYNKKNEQQEIL